MIRGATRLRWRTCCGSRDEIRHRTWGYPGVAHDKRSCRVEAGWRVSRALVAIMAVSVEDGVVVARAEGGICGRRGSGVGSGAAGVAAHASAGVLPSSA